GAAELTGDVSGDAEAEAESSRLAGDERREEGPRQLGRDAWTVVGDDNGNILFADLHDDGDGRVGPTLQGVGRILDQVDEDLLQPHLVGADSQSLHRRGPVQANAGRA